MSKHKPKYFEVLGPDLDSSATHWIDEVGSIGPVSDSDPVHKVRRYLRAAPDMRVRVTAEEPPEHHPSKQAVVIAFCSSMEQWEEADAYLVAENIGEYPHWHPVAQIPEAPERIYEVLEGDRLTHDCDREAPAP